MAKGKYEYWLTPDGLTLLQGWARDGLTNEQIAHNIGINIATLYGWKNKHSELNEALKKGREVVDYEVENALLRRAMGCTVEERHITEVGDKKTETIIQKELPPDTTALIYWLKNRRPKKWRDKPDVDADVVALEKLDGILKEFRDAVKQETD